MGTNSRLGAALATLLVVAAGCGGGSSKQVQEQPPPITPGTPFTLSGTVSYDFVPATYSPASQTGTLAFSSSTPRPVRNARVQVLQGAAGTVLAEATTSPTGAYTITFTPGASGALVLAVLAESVTPSIRVLDNTDGTLWAVGKPIASASPTLDVRATHGWNGTGYVAASRIAAPFAILDSMYTAARRFLDLPRTVPYPPLKVYWSPQNAPSNDLAPAAGRIGTSHYTPAEKAIYILGKEGVDTDEFDSHVIVHEWGHYFEDNLSRADSPGGPHGGGDVLDPRLAFGEGYGNAIAAMLLPESIYADTLWQPPGGSTIVAFGFDAATVNPTDDFADPPFTGMNPGPFSEMSVLRVLYRLSTGQAGLGRIYDTLVGPERTTDSVTTIASFVTGLKQQAGVDAAAVDAVLASRSIGPIRDEWGTGDPKLEAFFTQVPSLPYASPSVGLEGGFEPNKWQQNHFWVVTGTGRNVVVSATSSSDVGIVAFRNGAFVQQADALATGGTETMTFASVNGARYVVVLTGYEASPINYTATLSVTSP